MRERLTERAEQPVRRRKHARCVQCGKTRRAHCDFDEPGADHGPGCQKMHHEFKPGVFTAQPCSGCTALREALAEIAHSMSLDEATFKARKALFVMSQPDASDNMPTR